jgi:hypothetical protein
MPFFEGKQTLYQILCFIIIPIMVCSIFYYLKPQKLWVSPIITICVFLVISAIFYPYLFTDVLTNDYNITTIYWLMFVVPIQAVSTLFFTFITYFLIRRKTAVCKGD